MTDNVNHPEHYTAGKVECIDAIDAMLSTEQFKGFLMGQVLKYLWRARLKGAESEDHAKALWYHRRLEALLGGMDGALPSPSSPATVESKPYKRDRDFEEY